MKKLILVGAMLLVYNVGMAKKPDIDKVQNEIIKNHGNSIHTLNGEVGSNTIRLNRLENDVDNVGAMAMAISGIDFGEVKEGEVSIGIGVGHYSSTNAVAVGMNIGITENLTANWKFSATDGDRPDSALSAGVNYKFTL